MDKQFSAIYENGVFRPLSPVDLLEQTPVIVVQRAIPKGSAGILASAGAWSDADSTLEETLSQLADLRHHGRSLMRPDEGGP